MQPLVSEQFRGALVGMQVLLAIGAVLHPTEHLLFFWSDPNTPPSSLNDLGSAGYDCLITTVVERAPLRGRVQP